MESEYVFNGIDIRDIKTSITIDNITYDFVLEPRNGDIFGSGQDCVKCCIDCNDKYSECYCKICPMLYALAAKGVSRISNTYTVRYFKHYFIKHERYSNITVKECINNILKDYSGYSGIICFDGPSYLSSKKGIISFSNGVVLEDLMTDKEKTKLVKTLHIEYSNNGNYIFIINKDKYYGK